MKELRDIKGIGPVTERKLREMGIGSPRDLLTYYPSRYKENRLDNGRPWALGETMMLLCEVTADPRLFFIRKNLTKMTVKTIIDGHPVDVHIFNRHFLKKVLRPETLIVVTGTFKKNFRHFTASELILHKHFHEGMEPVYTAGDLSPSSFHTWILAVLEDGAVVPDDRLPDDLRHRRGLPPLKDMYRKIHDPADADDVAVAQKRIKYEEMLMFALRLHAQRLKTETIRVPRKGYDIRRVRRFIRTLPFELTDDQKQATNDIFRDLKKDRPMNRLLQGDVGSGKTICAMLAAYATITAGEQVAFMAPTDILARQHHDAFKKFLSPLDVDVRFLSAATPSDERASITKGLIDGTVDVIIGTHALLSDDVVFSALGFAIIDEQHRFGVAQRKRLRKKGRHPDVLYLSATPIPRTLAIGLMGNIDVSTIIERPEGRQPVKSSLVGYDELDRVFASMRGELSAGRQVFIVVPLINESDASSHVSIDAFESTLKGALPQKTAYGVLHGKMADEEKDDVMRRFKRNDIQVLLSTSVIEVGMDVPNATMMVIVNADRFGLSQLHQMRGRVGRGRHASQAYFVVDDPGKAKERLQILLDTDDGFKISEADLRMRGPGEVFGLNQSGIPRFMMADLMEDAPLFDKAQTDAARVFASADPKAKRLKKHAMKRADGFHLD